MMKRTTALVALVALATLCGTPALGKTNAGPAVTPTDPASLSVAVAPGVVMGADGTPIEVAGATLTFDPPEMRDWSGTSKAPRDFASWFTPWEPWPGRGQDRLPNTIELGPRRDDGVQILGALFRSIPPDSVVVTSADGSKTFVIGEDYEFNADWGQIANIKGRLGTHNEAELGVKCQFATQRIDLVQADRAGRLSVKRGKPATVCPMIPEADNGAVPVAGIYIAPWQAAGKYVIAAENILPINPAVPVPPINPEAVAATLAKLRAGEEVTIALMGDSITLGAEARSWSDDRIKFTAKDEAYRGRFIYGLRTRFEGATVKPVEAYEGGGTTKFGVKVLEETVLPAKPDLVTIAFGMNDATGPIGGKPRLSPEEFKKAILEIVQRARAAGIEVILVTPMQPNPWLKNEHAKRVQVLRGVLIEVGKETGVGVADVYTEWMNLPTRGIPPYSQLHNWNNHPGAYGHKVYADVILRFFE